MVTEVELTAHLDALRKRLSDLETDVKELARSVDIIEEFLDETLNIRWCHPELQIQQKPLPVKEEARWLEDGERCHHSPSSFYCGHCHKRQEDCWCGRSCEDCNPSAWPVTASAQESSRP